MKNICFITEDFYPDFIGGQGIYGKNLVENLAKKDIFVTVLAESKKGRKKFWRNKKSIKLILVPFCFGNQLILALLEYLYFNINERNNYYDIVHANQLSGFFFSLLKPKNVKKVVISVHNTNYDMSKVAKSRLKKLLYKPLIFLEKIMYKHADGLIFNSPDEEEVWRPTVQKKTNTASIYLGAEVPKFNQEQKNHARNLIRKQLGLSENEKIILYIGRLVKRKNIDYLIKAVKDLNISKNPVAAVIIGEGAEKANLMKISTSNVKFLGYIEKTKNYFLASDIFMMTSDAEGGFSLSVLEAASYGLPLIVSNSVAGFPIVEQNVNGFIIDLRKINDINDKILLAFKNYKKYSEESLRLSKMFTWIKTARKTLNFYQSLLEKPSDTV